MCDYTNRIAIEVLVFLIYYNFITCLEFNWRFLIGDLIKLIQKYVEIEITILLGEVDETHIK
jgi:hypothetical protein